MICGSGRLLSGGCLCRVWVLVLGHFALAFSLARGRLVSGLLRWKPSQFRFILRRKLDPQGSQCLRSPKGKRQRKDAYLNSHNTPPNRKPGRSSDNGLLSAPIHSTPPWRDHGCNTTRWIQLQKCRPQIWPNLAGFGSFCDPPFVIPLSAPP